MSDIAKVSNSLNGIPAYRYEETNTRTLKSSLGGLNGFGPLFGVNGLIGVGIATASIGSGDAVSTLCGLGFAAFSGLGLKFITGVDKLETVHRNIPGISLADEKKIVKAAKRRNRLKNTGTILEIASVDGENAYKIKVGTTDLKVTSYQLASSKQTWDNQMAMFKSAYGMDTMEPLTAPNATP